jgi:hypothetical protein
MTTTDFYTSGQTCSNIPSPFDNLPKTIQLSPFLFGFILTLPFLMPKLLFKSKKQTNGKVLFYHIAKESENPYIDEPTTISIYDQDTQEYYCLGDIYENEYYNELCNLLNKRTKNNKVVYLVTFDTNMQSMCLKSLLGEYFDNNSTVKEYKFLDIKQMFYMISPLVGKISFDEMKDYYKVPELDCEPLEYCAIFDQIIQDHDVKLDDYWEKVETLWEQL